VAQAAGGAMIRNVQRIEWEIAPLHAGVWSSMCNFRVTRLAAAFPPQQNFFLNGEGREDVATQSESSQSGSPEAGSSEYPQTSSCIGCAAGADRHRPCRTAPTFSVFGRRLSAKAAALRGGVASPDEDAWEQQLL
jgi:hypothetical protein